MPSVPPNICVPTRYLGLFEGWRTKAMAVMELTLQNGKGREEYKNELPSMLEAAQC